MACPTGASQAPERFSALRPPLDAGERSKVASPGCKLRRGNEMGCLTSWAGTTPTGSASSRPRESGDPWSPPVVMGPGSRCARPGRRWLGPSEAPTCGYRKRAPAAIHCFRPVIYN